MAIQKLNENKINFSRKYKYIIKSNGIIKIKQTLKENNNLIRYKNINKYYTLDLITGEIIKKNISQNRSQNIYSLKKTIKKMIEIIDYNFSSNSIYETLFITLTYKENMTDTKKLYKDMDKFIKKLKYHFKERGDIKYIYAVEPQGRGSWHIHMIITIEGVKYLFIDDKFIRKIWGHGITKTERPEGIKSIGSYISCYLTDLIEKDEEGNIIKKKKGERLYLYPAGINIYRHSRNVKIPQYKEGIGIDLIKERINTYSITYQLINYNEEQQKLKIQNSTTFAYYE